MCSVCVRGVLEYRIKTLKNGVAISMRMIRVTENVQVSPPTRGDPMMS